MNKCRTCDADLPAGKLFCSKCGTPGGATLPMTGPPIRRIKDRYEVIGSLGEGSYGSVFKVRDCHLQELLRNDPGSQGSADTRDCLRALKIPHERVIAEMGSSRFLDEIETLMSLSHPNIATIRDTGLTDDQRPFFTMDFCDGPTLAAEIRRAKRLPLDQFDAVAEGVLEALAYAHKNGVVHRDLKPSNIILSPRGSETVPRVVDFGIAKALQPGRGRTESLRGIPWGSPAYMSPEQVEGAKPTVQTDIYNAGATFYEALTGQPPLSGEDAGEIYAKVRHDVPKRPRLLRPEIPEHVDRAIMRSLAKRPQDRPGSAKQFLEELRRPKKAEWGARIGWAAAAVVVVAAVVILKVIEPPPGDANALARPANFRSLSDLDPSRIRDAGLPLAQLKLDKPEDRGTIQATLTDPRSPRSQRKWLISLSGPMEPRDATLRDLWNHQRDADVVAATAAGASDPPEGKYEFFAQGQGTRNGFTAYFDRTAPIVSIFESDGASAQELKPVAPRRYEASSFEFEVRPFDLGDEASSSPTRVMIAGDWVPAIRNVRFKDYAGKLPDLTLELKAEDACGNLSEPTFVVAPRPNLAWTEPSLEAGSVDSTTCTLGFDLDYPRPLSAVEVEVQPESGPPTVTRLDPVPGPKRTVSPDLRPGRNVVRLRAVDERRDAHGLASIERTVFCGKGLLFGVLDAGEVARKCVPDPTVVIARVEGRPGDSADELLAIECELDGVSFRRSWSSADLPLAIRLHDLTGATAETAKEGTYTFRRVVPDGVESRPIRLELDRTRPRILVRGSPEQELIEPSGTREPGLFRFPEREMTLEIRDRPVEPGMDPVVDWNGQPLELTRAGDGVWTTTLILPVPGSSDGQLLSVTDAGGNRTEARLVFVPRPEIQMLESPQILDLTNRVRGGEKWVWSARHDTLSLSGSVSHALGWNVRVRRVICTPASDDREEVRTTKTGASASAVDFAFDVPRARQPTSIRIEVEYAESELGERWRVQRELSIEYPELEFFFDETSQLFTNRDVSYRLRKGFRVKVKSVEAGRQIFAVWSPGAAADGPDVEMVLAGPAPMLPGIPGPVEKPFLIERFEVTAERIDAYERRIGRTGIRRRPPDDDPRRPAVGVTYSDAVDFASSEQKRLPTEAEWRTAAYWDGKQVRKYPWGDDWKWDHAYQRRPEIDSPPLITEYSGDVSYYGAVGMASGAKEWIDQRKPGSARQGVMGYHSIYSVGDDPRRSVEFNRDKFESSRQPFSELAENPGDRFIGFRCVLPLEDA